MSDFLKKLKNVFVVTDDSSSSTTTETPAVANNAATPSVQPVAPAPRVQSVQGSVTDKFMEILLGALEKNNLEGFDYFEFKQSLKNLSKMPMDEQTRFQSAYAMAQTMGVTPAKLVESVKHYQNVLGNEQAKFNEAHSQQRSRLIGNREEEIKQLESAIQQKSEQIKLMTQQIEEHRMQSEKIRKEIDESTIKIENTKSDFEATYASMMAQINEDLNKIQTYLK